MIAMTYMFNWAIGILFSTVVYCFTAFLCFSYVWGKKPEILIAGKKNEITAKRSLFMIDKIVKMIPVQNKFSLRIALVNLLQYYLFL